MRLPKNELLVLTIGLCIFLTNCLLFGIYFNEERQGYDDSLMGVDQYRRLLILVEGWTKLDVGEILYIRIFQVLSTLAILGTCWAIGLTTNQGASLFLVWPYSAFLAVKLKQEFILFPLAFIKVGGSLKQEILISIPIALLTLLMSENNGWIVLFFRWLVFCYISIPPKWVIATTAAIFAATIFADLNFGLVLEYVPPLRVFRATREFINPEYSFFESIAVFMASMHLGINPPKDWWFHIPFAVMALTIAFIFYPRKASVDFNPDAWRIILAAATVFFFFVSITHAFQNARYYYFVVLLLFPVINPKAFALLGALSLAHSVAAIIVYENLY